MPLPPSKQLKQNETFKPLSKPALLDSVPKDIGPKDIQDGVDFIRGKKIEPPLWLQPPVIKPGIEYLV